MIVGYTPRDYHVVKVRAGRTHRYMVLGVDLNDPDVWVLINHCSTAREAWEYITEIQARARKMVEAV